jgi:hypothetical protein
MQTDSIVAAADLFLYGLVEAGEEEEADSG